MNNYCLATYRCYDEKVDFAKKATSIAVGLTVGSWTDLPETKKAEMEKHLGKVISIQVHESSDKIGGNTVNHRYADIQIAYPDLNFSSDLPALLVTVFGKLSMDGAIKLIDLAFSANFLRSFNGPKLGIQGVRNRLGVQERPLLMSIFKSVIGHDLPNLREQFYQQALGGVDLIKDDEILFENPLTPLEHRVEVCMEAARQAEAETGQKLLYAANLSGSTLGLVTQAKKAIAAGANALLFNVLAYGFDMLHELSSDPDIDVPIVAHPALAGTLYPSPQHGISASLLLGKLMRIAGADLVLFPSPYGSVVMPREENMAIKHALLTIDVQGDYIYTTPQAEPDTSIAADAANVDRASTAKAEAGTAKVTTRDADNEHSSVDGQLDVIKSGIDHVSLLPSFPVPSAGIHPGLVPLILRDFGHEVVVNAGGGIHGHPLGTAAGGRAFRQAIDACVSGQPLREYALEHQELQVAIDTWGFKE